MSARSVWEIVDRDIWSIAEGRTDKGAFVIRFRSEFKQRLDVSDLPRLVSVVWGYESDETGMPNPDTTERMRVFEDRLISAVETPRIAVLTAVVTSFGERQWLFYTADVAGFGDGLNNMPQERSPYPIRLKSSNDPEWAGLYEGVLSAVAD